MKNCGKLKLTCLPGENITRLFVRLSISPQCQLQSATGQTDMLTDLSNSDEVLAALAFSFGGQYRLGMCVRNWLLCVCVCV